MASDRTHELRFYISEKEYEQIASNAKQVRMQVNPFVRRAACNYCIFERDRTELDQHLRAISTLIKALNTFICSVEEINMYQPRDMPLIVSMLDEIIECARMLLRAVVYRRTKLDRQIERETTRMIEQIDWQEIPRPNKNAERRNRSIRIKVNPDEHQQIAHIASLHRLPVGVYIRYVSLNPKIETVYFSDLVEQNRLILAYVKQLLIISKQTQQSDYYRPQDVLSIIRYFLTLVRKERELLKANIYRCPKLEPVDVKFKEAVTLLDSQSWSKEYSINLDGYESDYLYL